LEFVQLGLCDTTTIRLHRFKRITKKKRLLFKQNNNNDMTMILKKMTAAYLGREYNGGINVDIELSRTA